MGNDHVPSAAAPGSAPPRWVRAADGLTVLLGLAAFQAAAFGGFQIPGLSVTNPWRPLVMAAVLAGLRHYLVPTPPIHARVWRGAARASGKALQPRVDLRFFQILDFLVLSVVSTSFTAIALLAVHRFDARIAVIAGLIVAAAVRWFTPARFDAGRASAGDPVAPALLLVLLTALLFRTEPFPSLYNAQDSGVHVSLSAHLQRDGSAFVDDPLPDALPDQRSRDIYRAGLPADPEHAEAGRPGLYYSSTRGGYVFESYHLHPLWMAIFAELFGDAARFHVLSFFGLLGVLGLSLLAFELTWSRPAAFAAGMLAATNPLHVFFSRFPVPEAVVLAFSSLGFYYLARGFRGLRRGDPAAGTASFATLAAACISLVFFVRITGFLYVLALAPLFALGAWLTLRGRRAWGRHLLSFCGAVAALYGVSVLYGLAYTPGFAASVYQRTLGNLLGDGWPLVVTGAAALVIAGLAEVVRNPRHPAVRRLLASAAEPRPWIRLASLLVAAAVAGSLLQAYLIGFTEGHAPGRRTDLVGSGAAVFLQSGAMGWLLYATPWLALIAIRGVHRPPRRWPAAMLYVFLAICMAATLPLNAPVIQHPYYARYLVGEIVPYSLVIAVIVTFRAAPGAFRRLSVAAVLAAIAFQLFFTAKQMPSREGVQPYDVMSRIADAVGTDVLLFDVDGFQGGEGPGGDARLQTPLTHYFGLHVFPYREPGRLADIVPSFEGAVGGGRLWLLTPAANAHPGLELHETLAYEDRRTDGAPPIPATVDDRYRPRTLFLYRQR